MKTQLSMMMMAMVFSALTGPASGAAQVETFDQATASGLPAGWRAGVTGSGAPHWTVEADSTAPSPPNVLKQSGQGPFPWCVKQESALQDGFVEVKFKPVSGKKDQAGGLVWRFKDGNTYYVARANALENNVSIYYTQDGKRNTIQYVDANRVGVKITAGRWYTLRVEFEGSHAVVFLDGKKVIDVNDDHLSGPGAVGVWTKADSVTLFDDFTFGGK